MPPVSAPGQSEKWRDVTWVAFDIETSGKYPLADEICEIAAVKWKGGKIVDSFQSFVKISGPMPKEVIEIHHITDEMLIGAPPPAEVVAKFLQFIEGACLVAHHAPFDLGFTAVEIERARLRLPNNAVLCTSLISRKAVPETENHRLATLVKYFNLDPGQAHRALDDARVCLEVALKCFERIGADVTVDELEVYQETVLRFSGYSILDLNSHPVYKVLIEALQGKTEVQIVYNGGSRPGEARTVFPIGLVRNPGDDFLVARDAPGEVPKRYFLHRISAARI